MTGQVSVYYNEFDPFAAAWLRELIRDGHIAPGEVDERDIREVSPDDLRGFTQCHFFAGIGGWSLALRLAGWPDDRPVWTGSCPCQPFSAAGVRKGVADDRHLWPAFHRLIRECRPPVVFGEQVDAAIRHGWVDLVQADLEMDGYAVGWADLPAASVGAPHRRQRLWFVGTLAHAISGRGREASGEILQVIKTGTNAGELDATSRERRQSGLGGFWSRSEWLPCRDGNVRPAEPGIFPLADGVPNSVGTLRGAGNAIVPQVAAEFIKAYREVIGENGHGL